MMRFAAVVLFFAAVANHASADDSFNCADCKARIDLARDCMDTGCGAGTESARDACLLSASNVATFKTCCGFNDICTQRIDDAVQCVDGSCIDTCVLTKVFAYASCLNTNSATCTQEDCLDIVQDAGDDASANVDAAIGGNDSAFTCDAAEANADDICNDGEQCCLTCNEKLAELVDCVYNDVLVPWLEAEYNKQYEDNCSIMGACNFRRRELGDRAERVLQDEPTEEDLAVFTDCGEKMALNMVAGNATSGMNEFLNCSLAEAITDLPEGPAEEAAETTEESGAAATGVLGLISGALAAVAVAAM